MSTLALSTKATQNEIKSVTEHFQGYTKVVVDIEKEILCAGADRHIDEEEMLLLDGSKQNNLWGGGVDMETHEIDYNSMINLRPNQDNPSRDILSQEIRAKFDEIVTKIFI
jgi:hypothetical protein